MFLAVFVDFRLFSSLFLWNEPVKSLTRTCRAFYFKAKIFLMPGITASLGEWAFRMSIHNYSKKLFGAKLKCWIAKKKTECRLIGIGENVKNLFFIFSEGGLTLQHPQAGWLPSVCSLCVILFPPVLSKILDPPKFQGNGMQPLYIVQNASTT